MQTSVEEKLDPDQVISYTETKLIPEFAQNLILNDDSIQNYNYEDEEEEEEEFSFMCGDASTSPIAAEDVFINGQIKPVFPLFNRDLLISGDDLPMKPLVNKVFVETNEENFRMTSSTPGNDEISGPYCEWSNRKAVEVSSSGECKKSNSTGFSRIWRFRDLMGRSNSDGRDTFVFLNNGHAPPPVAQKPEAVKREDTVDSGKVKKTSKNKTTPLSPHEVYLKSKATEGRRRSYLPYKPELVGFFTNVNGGLTKNVHPF